MNEEKFEAMLLELTESLIESMMMLISAEKEKTRIGEFEDYDIAVAAGDVVSPHSNKQYQIQVALVRNKHLWLEEKGVQFRDAVGVTEVGANFKPRDN